MELAEELSGRSPWARPEMTEEKAAMPVDTDHSPSKWRLLVTTANGLGGLVGPGFAGLMMIIGGRLNALLSLVAALGDDGVALAAPCAEMRKGNARVSGE